jgi:hypothetical protein
MVPGDYPATARVIARRVGLDSGDLLIDEDLERMRTSSGASDAARFRIPRAVRRIRAGIGSRWNTEPLGQIGALSS